MSRKNIVMSRALGLTMTPTQRATAEKNRKAALFKLDKNRRARSNQMVISVPRSMPARQTYSAPRSEVKCVDSNFNISIGNVVNTTNTNANINVVNCIQPGSGSWNRIGKKIRMKSIRYKAIVVNRVSTATGSTSNNTIRIVLVYDRQPSSGAVPTFDTIFGSTDQTGAEATQSIYDNIRIDNTERFVVLKDDVYSSDMQPVPTGSLSEWEIHIDHFISLKGLDTVYSGQSNPCTIADISTGALYLITRADGNGVETGQAGIGNSSIRLRYFD